MELLIGLIIGLVAGLVLGLLISTLHRRHIKADREAALQQMRETFSDLAVQALDANTKRLTLQADSSLESKKKLIDQSIQAVNERLKEQREFLQRTEGERKTEYGKLSSSVGTLAITTGELHKVLASTQRRGAWGERMVEDILRLVGMTEGVNYRKQKTIEDDGASSRPDFTFMLPNDLVVNMDAKFPHEHYKAYLDAADEAGRVENSRLLVRDVRGYITDISRRGYVNTKEGTVPYVLMFIASEQIFSLVMEAQPDLIDEALGKHVVLTSPMTLYAMLAVIRQSAERANLMKTTDEVIAILGAFDKQWQKYNEQLDMLGKYLGQATAKFQDVSGTRSNALQRQLNKIEDLRQQQGLPESPESSND